MNLLNKFKIISVHGLKCNRSISTSSSIAQFVHHFHTATPLLNKELVIAHLCEKLCCSEEVAKCIYNKFPSLRSIDAIQNDSLKMLRDKVPAQSIVENPSLVTMNKNTLESKIKLLYAMEPRKLEDFVPLLTMDENHLEDLVKQLIKEKKEIPQGNRIYYISEKLQVEPKMVSQLRADCRYDLFSSNFRSFKKKLDIVLDYGANRMDVLKGLWALRINENVFVRRSERMISIGFPIKLWCYQVSEKDFDNFIQRHAVQKNRKISGKTSRNLKKRNSVKTIIVETFKTLLECDNSESSEIYYSYINEISELNMAKENIQYLLSISINRETIKKNGFLLSMPLSEIQVKLDILREMHPKNIEDFIPLMSMDASELTKYKTSLEKVNSLGSDHPIYHFSERLNVPVNVVAARFVEKKRIFLNLKPDRLKPKLDILLKHDVDRLSILNSPATFTHSEEKIEQIISKLYSKGIDKISSWMIFSSSSPLHDKLVSNRVREKTSLEGFRTSMEYIAHRLGWDENDLQNALTNFPKLQKMSASKIKKHLDFFLNETQITAENITHYPSILNRSAEEIKLRVIEMTRIGAPITLIILDLGKTRYLKYIRRYCDTREEGEIKMEFLNIEKRIKREKTINELEEEEEEE